MSPTPINHVVWTQWDDLEIPSAFKKLSPVTTPADGGDFSQVTFYVPAYMGGRAALELTKQMPNLKILQMPNAGYDDALAYLRPGLTLCNASGVHDASTAELAVGLALASRRGFPEFIRDQIAGTWDHRRFTSLSDSKIGVIGFGSIGKQVVKNLSGFDVSVTSFSKSGRDGSIKIDELDKHLPTLDIVILILPLTDDSRHMFNKERLAKMKDGALIVNVARGPIIETDALIAELNSGRIFAALDVTDPEPLPAGHPLWKAKNLLLVPHVGGNSTAFEPRGRKLVESQLKLLAEGKPLNNIVAVG
jgi:phosphoglycerate dehydrogenase-like enzyme